MFFLFIKCILFPQFHSIFLSCEFLYLKSPQYSLLPHVDVCICVCVCACTYTLLCLWIYLKLSVWAWMVQVHLRDSDISMLLYCLCFNEAYFDRSLTIFSSNFNYIMKSKHLVLFILKAVTVTLISSTVLFLYQVEQLKLLSNSFPSKSSLFFVEGCSLATYYFFPQK